MILGQDTVDTSRVVGFVLADHKYCFSSENVLWCVQEVSVGCIKFLINIRMCGRPKAAAKTVIGSKKVRELKHQQYLLIIYQSQFFCQVLILSVL